MAESARDGILGILRAAARNRDDGAARAAVTERVKAHPRNLIPARGQDAGAKAVDRFIQMATASAATVAVVPNGARVPHAVADYLSAHNLPSRVRVGPDPDLAALPWSRRPTLEVLYGPAAADDLVSVTPALAAVAETGTLMTRSGPGHPTTLNFLPNTHIVVLPVERVVGSYEDAWDLLRAGLTEGADFPRTVNFITGPSRTADIEQTPQLHAHGPGRLHILLVGDAAAPQA